MYINRPHLRYNGKISSNLFDDNLHGNLFTGVYISKMSYLRQGEVSLDGLYSPFHIVEYYRYIRFYPDGRVVHLTSPDHPRLVVGLLKWNCRLQGLQYGYYKVAGEDLTIVLKRRQSEKYVYRGYKTRRNKNAENNSDKQKFQAVSNAVKVKL